MGVPLLGCLMVKVCLKTGQDVTLRVLKVYIYIVSQLPDLFLIARTCFVFIFLTF